MNTWERWLQRPKSLWLRKALFQVHLWTGIALGLYVFAISISGSAIVFRNEFYKTLWPGPRIVAVSGHRFTHDEIREAARRAYPRYKVSWIWDAKVPNQATEIWLDRNGNRKERLFDPYTGRDLGESRPHSIQLLAWLADLHINLLSGKTGRLVNGLLAICVLVLAMTGAVLCWPGTRSWRRAFALRPKSNWKLFNWQLHSVGGLWMLPFVFMFGVVGTYSAFPRPFQVLVNRFAPLDVYRLEPQASIEKDLLLKESGVNLLEVTVPSAAAQPRVRRPRFIRPKLSIGDKIVRWFSYLHFGNFGGWGSKALWVVVGLAPAFLAVTGVLMWWNRVLSPGARRLRRAQMAGI
ncbi:MAG: PepSY domain-containing protein [Bryobacterales bacterium]|nr:PepSY domain-containing protein [Bryobacterales bacterium]